MSDEEVIFVDEHNNRVQPPKGYSSPRANYPPTISGGEKADLLDKIKPDLIVEIIRHKLMGEEKENGKWIKKEALKERSISESGAWDIANLMIGASSQNVSLSKLTNGEIRTRTLSIVKTAQSMCLKNWKEYNIKGVDQLAFVHEIVFTNTFITLKQPEGGGIRKLIGEITTESRQITSNEPIKRGLFRLRMK